MTVRRVQMGQVWRSAETDESWLFTKVYTEIFTSYAVLRKVGGGDVDMLRVKVLQSPGGPTLPGFSPVEE